MIGSQDFRVFLSAVSSEFGEARSGVASDLRARGIEVKVQEDFRQEAGSDTTLGKLHDYIRDCSAVVCVIGERSGSVPPEAAAVRFAELLPEGLERASYTQWELLFARRHGKRLSIYHAGAGYVPDRPEPTGEDEPELQARFVRWLFEEQGLDRGTFSNPDALGRLVLREDWPKQRTRIPVVLPYPSLGDLFRGREGFLERLRESLQSGGDAQATAIAGQVLHGLGGVGKTRLAVEYAWRHLHDYSAVLFVPAETAVLLQQSLAALCGAEALDLPEKAAPEEAAQVAAALGWLAEHPGWLLILDNLDTQEAAAAAEGLLPRLRGGHVLLTGRLAEWGGDIRALELDVLEEDEAARFLLDRTEQRRRRQATDEADALELARELDGLALALEQAGAYIVQRRLSLEQYLEDWRAGARGVKSWYDARTMKYPRSVASTWQTTVDRLSAGELALLRLLAWFAPEPVPQFVFEAKGALEIWKEAIGLLRQEEDPEAGEGDLLTALAGLAGYSMLRWDGQTQAATVHRVVQEILRRRLEEPVRREWLILSLRLLDGARPGNPHDVRTWPEWDGLRPHVGFGARFGEEVGAPEPTTVLMNELGQLLRAKALNAEAEPLMRRALEIDEASYGPDHPEVAIRLNNLAQLLKATNRLAEAEPLMRRALEIDEASYGPDHPDVAIDLNNLAALLQATNRLAEAEPLMRRALEIDEASYGPDHPKVAIRLNNLAQLLKATNRLAEAEPLMRRALEIDEASYGPDHPDVAIDLNNLAALLQATNRLAEAEPLMRRALEIDEASYGPDHPKVAIDLNNLAQLLQATNRMAEAEPLMRRALEIDEASCGPDHPDVAIDLNNLAQLLQATNRLAEAEPLMRRALEIDEASYGPDHPKVAIRLNNLAQLLQATNRLAEAEPLMRRMVVIFLRFQKRTAHEHPHLQAALGNYAGLLAGTGRSEKEIPSEIERLRAEVVAQFPFDGGD